MLQTPIELLQQTVQRLERDLEKSFEMFDQEKIGKHVHAMHKKNLAPMIEEYKKAIEKLLKP